MAKNYKKYLKFIFIFTLFCTFVSLSGCKKTDDSLEGSVRQPQREEKEKKHEEKSLYLIRELNLDEEKITLEELFLDGRILRRKYSLLTRFENKYKEISSWDKFSPGRVVTIEESKDNVALKKVSLSDKVWELSKITKYKIISEDNIMIIGDEKYSLSEDTPVFSNDKYASLSSIGEEDELRIVGIGKKIISIVITTGHGTIELVNTDVFRNSMINIGNTVFTSINEEGMKIDVPEGSYDLTVANDGYGGTKKINVERGKTVIVNLNELKGEGPKYASITFRVKVENAKILLDNKEQPKDTPISVKYGRHSLKVFADGYNNWEKTLYVNSPSSEIMLDLSDEKINPNNKNITKPNDNPKKENKKTDDDVRKEDKDSDNKISNDKKTRRNRKSKNRRSILDKDYINTLKNTMEKILGK